MTETKDMLGFPVKVGDEIIYAKGGQAELYLFRMVVKEIDKFGNVNVGDSWSNRASYQILSLEGLKQSHSSLFI